MCSDYLLDQYVSYGHDETLWERSEISSCKIHKIVGGLSWRTESDSKLILEKDLVLILSAITLMT